MLSRVGFKRFKYVNKRIFKRYIKRLYDMKQKYSIKELAEILGCSITAVQKKIVVVENNPVIRRYKKRYDVVIEYGKSYILLEDEELEEEKRLSKGFKNVSKNVNENPEKVIDVDYSSETTMNKDDYVDKVLEFTERYIERYETLQKTYYNELQQKDKQILLLTTSENNKQEEYLAAKAKTIELEKRNRSLLLYLTFISTLFITLLIVIFKQFLF